MHAAEDAGQRFDHGRIAERNIIGNFEQILFNDAGRNANVLGICAVIEEQIFAEILLALAAIETDAAGRRIRGNYAHALAEASS